MRKYNPSELPVNEDLLAKTTIQGEINIEQLVFRQIERCYVSASQDETLFAANIRTLLSSIPSHKQTEISDRRDEYASIVQQYQYKYNCGVQLGTPEEPINNSPALIEEEVIDWHKLFEIILSALEDCGVTWELEKWTIEVGKVEDEKSTPPPTPIFANKFETSQSKEVPTDTNAEAVKKKERVRSCAICEKPVVPGTGIFYPEKGENRKLVHKETCLGIAKVKLPSDEKQ